jgi:hypothetical protein
MIKGGHGRAGGMVTVLGTGSDPAGIVSKDPRAEPTRLLISGMTASPTARASV